MKSKEQSTLPIKIKKDNPLMEISKVDSSLEAFTQTGSASINSLDVIKELYSKTLTYKTEVKRLNVEKERIRKQAEIIHNKINADFKLNLKILQERENTLASHFLALDRKLKETYIERKKLLQMAKDCMTNISKRNISIEEKKMHHESFHIIMDCIKGSSNNDIISLQEVIGNLPRIELSQKLIED